MNGTPPTPETSVSLFVAVLVAVAALIMVLARLVVRRRHQLLPMLALSLVTLVVVGVGAVYLIVPPQVPSAGASRVTAQCPYDRLTWSNMRSDVDEFWQPCRRVARLQLALMLLGGSAVTVMAAAMVLKRPAGTPPDQTPDDQTQIEAYADR